MCKGSAEECHSLEPVHLELEVISLQPRAFVIKNFLSDFEAEEIISYGSPRLGKSIVGDVGSGAFESDTRTSKNTWLPRKTSDITDTLFRRAADLLQLDEKILDRHKAAEDLQIVHYQDGQKYDSHHDWGVNGHPESRFITLLLYLNDLVSPDAGGETAFPKANDGLGIKIHPGKGSAVLFYDLLEDGNGDDLSLHAALPIRKGEKWLANFWVWDPKFSEE
jgi:prolyl 4-hydroxylase